MKKVYIILAALLLIVATYFIYKYYFAIDFEEVTIERTTENCEDNCFSVNLNYLKCKGASEFATNFNKEIELQIANFLLCNDDDSLQIDDVSIEKALDNFLPKILFIVFSIFCIGILSINAIHIPVIKGVNSVTILHI